MATIDVKDAADQTVAIEKPNANGRAGAAASRPVALSTEDKAALDGVASQVTLAAVLTALGEALTVDLPSGASTAANQTTLIGHVDGIEGALTTLNGKDFATQTTLAAILAKIIAAPATEAKQDTIIGHVDGLETAVASTNTLLTTQNGYLDGLEGYVDGLEGQLGIVTETAPGSDTASSGLNGRLQRIAQRLTSLIALLPGALTGNGGMKVGVVDALPAGSNVIGKVGIDADLTAGEYETVAASQTDQIIGATGAAGDYLAGVLIVPATTSPGTVSIKDGSGTAITIFTGGASSVSNLVPFLVPLGIKCATNWKITTGANVSAIGIGNFT